LLSLSNGLLAIVDNYNFPRSGALEKTAQGSPNRRIIFRNQYSNGHANRASKSRRVAPYPCFPTTLDALRSYHEPLFSKYTLYTLPFITRNTQRLIEP
jgi:hypothetical protein